LTSKIETYLGFCIKANKIVLGIDNIEQKRNIPLLIVDESISLKSMENAKRLQEKFACPMIVFPSGALGEKLHKPAVKIAGIQEKNLVSAILTEAGHIDELKVYSGGRNKIYGKEI
jgi:hypothetical protein